MAARKTLFGLMLKSFWLNSSHSRMGEFPLMADATTNRHLSATVLLSKGLTPGKLRGLQRISNPNGTLTMLAA